MLRLLWRELRTKSDIGWFADGDSSNLKRGGISRDHLPVTILCADFLSSSKPLIIRNPVQKYQYQKSSFCQLKELIKILFPHLEMAMSIGTGNVIKLIGGTRRWGDAEKSERTLEEGSPPRRVSPSWMQAGDPAFFKRYRKRGSHSLTSSKSFSI